MFFFQKLNNFGRKNMNSVAQLISAAKQQIPQLGSISRAAENCRPWPSRRWTVSNAVNTSKNENTANYGPALCISIKLCKHGTNDRLYKLLTQMYQTVHISSSAIALARIGRMRNP